MEQTDILYYTTSVCLEDAVLSYAAAQLLRISHTYFVALKCCDYYTLKQTINNFLCDFSLLSDESEGPCERDGRSRGLRLYWTVNAAAHQVKLFLSFV